MIRVRRECGGIGRGNCHVIASGERSVLAHRVEWRGEDMIFAHNLAGEGRQIVLDLSGHGPAGLDAVFGGAGIQPAEENRCRIELGSYGYVWFRIVTRTRAL